MKLLIAFLFFAFSGCNADKIIGGTAASSGEFPSIVYFTKAGSFFCAGTIISPTRILSAAHCEQSLYALSAVAGTTSRDSGGVIKIIAAKLVHPDYNSNTIQNDIMILTVGAPFDFSSAIQAATLVPASPSAGTGCTVAGWGDMNPGVIVQDLSNDLMYVNVPIVSLTDCNDDNSYGGSILSGMLCAGISDGGKDACQGDSGGPLYIQGTNELVGVVSWGDGCAKPNKPGVYTDVAYYYGWIIESTPEII